MEATSKKAANSVLRIVVAIGLLTGLIVVPIATASATAPNNGAPVDNLNPRTAAGTTGWNTPAVLANDVQTCSSLKSTDFPTGTDLYHFVVTSESKTTVERVIPNQTRTWTDNRGSFSKTGTLTVTYTFDRSANFMKNNPPLGSVRVKYASEDPDTDWVESPTRPGAEETLPWTSFNYKNVSPNHIYVAVPKGNTLVDAKLNYDIDINNLRKTEKLEWTETSRNNTRTESQTFPIQGNGTLQIAVDDTNYLSTQSAYTQNLTSSHNLSHTCANPASPTITLSSATAGYTVTYTKSHAWTITKDFVTINEETPQESYFDKGIAPRFTIDITRNEAEIDAASYELATATVTGTFSLEAASLNDASVKLAVADVSDITCNTEDDNNTNDNLYKYSCTWNPTLKPTGKNALQDYSWTVSGTVTGGSSTPSTREGKYGLNSGETQRDSNLNATVDFSDDLANLAAQRDELERIERVLVAGGGTADDESDDVYAWDIDCDGPACTIGDAEFKRGLVAGGGTAEDESDDVYAWEIDCNDVACTVDDRNTDTTNDDQLVVYNGWTLESLDCGSLTCVVSKDKLTASAISGNATITYTSPWNWKQYTDETTCTKGWTNTATLTAGNGSVAYSWDTNCPPPTVTINSDIESSYKVTYDNVYDWVVTKTFDGQDRGGTNRQATLVANYTVTASRNPNPTVENRQGSALTVTGTFETTFASYDNVEVTVDLIGGDSGTPIYTRVGSCDEEAASATLTRDNGKFTCTIPASDLPLIETNDGWDAEDLRITASVTTAGGKDDDVTTHGIGKPDESTGSNVHDTAKIVDDSGGYKAINVSCTTIPSETNCLIDADGIITSGVIETSESNETITLTYSLDWLAVADPSAACPSIANKADVMGDVIMGEPVLLDTGTSTEPMTCPTLTFEITQTPAHGIKYDDTYTWTVVKTADGSDVDTWKPKYKVVVTRNASTETGHQIIDASQQVTGQVTLKTQVEQVNSSGTWIDVNPTSFQPTKEKITSLGLTLSTGPTTCTFSEESFEDTDGKFAFTCLVEVESVVTTRNGLNGTTYNLAAAGELFKVPARNGSFENNAWGMPFRPFGSEGGKTVDATATLSDNTATLGIYGTATGITGGIDNNKIWSARNLPNTDNPGVKPSSDSLDLTWTLRYTLDWKIDVTGCDKEFTNTASLTRSDTTEALTDSETGKVTCPNAIPAFTIGYYGNKAGGTQVWKNKEQWRTNKPVWAPAWHNALGTGHKLDYGLPDFRDDSAVRTYMTNANCNSGGANSGGKTCQTMFRAQALASVNNAIRNGAPLQGYMVSGGTIGRQFANQGVLFRDPADATAKCWKVHNILAELEFVGPSSVDGGTTAALIDRRIAYKTIFDDLNNARAKRCPLVP